MLQLGQKAVAVTETVAVRHNPWFGVWVDIAQVLWHNRKSRVGLVIFFVFVVAASTGSLFAPYSVNDSSFPPMIHSTWQHWLGTTQGGQDVLSQLIVGTRTSIITAFGVGLIATVLAVIIGLASGYTSGWLDDVLSFITNVFLVLPGLPLLIVLASYAPGKGAGVIILIVGLTSWPWGARVLRAQAATLRARDFVVAARLAGDSVARILLREILTNMQSLVAANFLGASLYGLLTAVGLEFLGLGNPSDTSWGSMLYWAQNGGALLLGQWAWILAPGVCIALFGMSMVLINFGFDELSNPRLRSDAE